MNYVKQLVYKKNVLICLEHFNTEMFVVIVICVTLFDIHRLPGKRHVGFHTKFITFVWLEAFILQYIMSAFST